MTEHPSRPPRVQSLLVRIRGGCEAAAAELVRSMSTHIRRVIERRMDQRLRQKYDTEDVAQMVWASFFRNRWRAEDFSRHEQLRQYLVAVARHKVIQVIRRHVQATKRDVRREWSLEDSVHRTLPAIRNSTTASQLAMRNECIESCLRGEKPHVATILMRRLAGTSYVDIARELDLHERTVRRTMQRLIGRIQDHVQGQASALNP